MKSPKEVTTIANIMGGVPILGVLPGSPAALAGLQYGDIVMRVNGVQTETFVEFIKAHDSSARGLELDVFRNGHNLTLVLSARALRTPAGTDEMTATPARFAAPAAKSVALNKLS